MCSLQAAAMMSPAPPPPEKVGKAKDVSFDREKTMMRILLTDGYGNEARDGSHVNVHWTVSIPNEDGSLQEIYNTEDKFPRGVKFTIGRTTYCEAVERSVVAMKPGSVFDCFCTDMEAASCPELGFKVT